MIQHFLLTIIQMGLRGLRGSTEYTEAEVYSFSALKLPIRSSHKYVVSYYEFVREFEVDYSQRSSLSFQL